MDQSLFLRCDHAILQDDMLSLVERVKTSTQAWFYGASPRPGKEKLKAWRREAKLGPKRCHAVRACDSARTPNELGGERNSVYASLVQGFEPITRRGDMLSLVERSKTWTQALSCDASRDSARRHSKPGGRRQSVDPRLVLRCEPTTLRGKTMSLVKRGKMWTRALSRGSSPRLGEETRLAW